jgi:FG-GAP-like repeat/RTX calcium-binding nonapeptide repeat (4 copies)
MATQITQREEDGSIPSANPTGLNPGNVDVAFAIAQIGDGAFGTTTGDFDFYRVDAAAGSFITARTLSAVFGLDSELRVYNSAGTIVAFGDDFDGVDSFVQLPVVTAGPYFVAVSQFKVGNPNPSNPFVAGTGTGGPDVQPPNNYRVFINNDNVAETPTAGAETINGNAEANLLVGGGGADTINGNAGDDVIEGGTGGDNISGGGGNDLIIWRNGDGTDLVDGGAGSDRQQVFLSNGGTGDIFNISAVGNSANFNRTNLGLFAVNTVNVERMDVFALGGADTATVNNLAGTSIVEVRLFMGGGNDIVNGGATATPLTIQGGPGADTMTGGSADDTYVYAPGDGADIITNFVAGNGNPALDHIDLTAFSNIHNLGDVLARATQVGNDTFINFGSGDTITLQNVVRSALSFDDFILINKAPIDGGFAGDVSGDGKSDIVISNDAGGTVFVWQMDGFAIKAVQAIGAVGREWHIADNADFNGDNVNDILWRADDGTVMNWQMQGGLLQTAAIIGRVGNEWHVGGTGDFNGDGTDDILWQRADGTLLQFQMQNGQIQTAPTFGAIGPEWHDVGIGDFNGDGKSDILWRRDDGTLLDFQMNGTQINAQTVGVVGREWHVEGVADFNGDGKSDILWQNDSGLLMLWQMNGSSIQSSQTLAGLLPDWHLSGTADVDGDHKADILWRNDDGTVAVWEMDGASIKAAQVVAPLDQTSSIGVHHYDLL